VQYSVNIMTACHVADTWPVQLSLSLSLYIYIYIYVCNLHLHQKNKDIGKAVPLQAWIDPEGSRKLRFPDFMTTVQGGGKVVSLTH